MEIENYTENEVKLILKTLSGERINSINENINDLMLDISGKRKKDEPYVHTSKKKRRIDKTLTLESEEKRREKRRMDRKKRRMDETPTPKSKKKRKIDKPQKPYEIRKKEKTETVMKIILDTLTLDECKKLFNIKDVEITEKLKADIRLRIKTILDSLDKFFYKYSKHEKTGSLSKPIRDSGLNEHGVLEKATHREVPQRSAKEIERLEKVKIKIKKATIKKRKKSKTQAKEKKKREEKKKKREEEKERGIFIRKEKKFLPENPKVEDYPFMELRKRKLPKRFLKDFIKIMKSDKFELIFAFDDLLEEIIIRIEEKRDKLYICLLMMSPYMPINTEEGYIDKFNISNLTKKFLKSIRYDFRGHVVFGDVNKWFYRYDHLSDYYETMVSEDVEEKIKEINSTHSRMSSSNIISRGVVELTEFYVPYSTDYKFFMKLMRKSEGFGYNQFNYSVLNLDLIKYLDSPFKNLITSLTVYFDPGKEIKFHRFKEDLSIIRLKVIENGNPSKLKMKLKFPDNIIVNNLNIDASYESIEFPPVVTNSVLRLKLNDSFFNESVEKTRRKNKTEVISMFLSSFTFALSIESKSSFEDTFDLILKNNIKPLKLTLLHPSCRANLMNLESPRELILSGKMPEVLLNPNGNLQTLKIIHVRSTGVFGYDFQNKENILMKMFVKGIDTLEEIILEKYVGEYEILPHFIKKSKLIYLTFKDCSQNGIVKFLTHINTRLSKLKESKPIQSIIITLTPKVKKYIWANDRKIVSKDRELPLAPKDKELVINGIYARESTLSIGKGRDYDTVTIGIKNAIKHIIIHGSSKLKKITVFNIENRGNPTFKKLTIRSNSSKNLNFVMRGSYKFDLDLSSSDVEVLKFSGGMELNSLITRKDQIKNLMGMNSETPRIIK